MTSEEYQANLVAERLLTGFYIGATVRSKDRDGLTYTIVNMEPNHYVLRHHNGQLFWYLHLDKFELVK